MVRAVRSHAEGKAAIAISQWEVWRLGPGPGKAMKGSSTGEARPRCPRCGAARVHRWGRFSGRQRHRCTACRRTFSTFTSTPLAGSPLLQSWAPYFAALVHRLPVRAAAEEAGISVATAFRRRHRVLRWVLEANRRHPPLRTAVVVRETRFAESFKGSRSLARPARTSSIPIGKRFRSHRNAIVVHCCPLLPPTGSRRVTRTTLAGVFDPSPRYLPTATLLKDEVAPATLLTSFPPRGQRARGGPARGTHTREPTSMQGEDLRSDAGRDLARARARFRGWMSGFRGVATRYLAHYAAWFERVDAHRLVEDTGEPVQCFSDAWGGAFAPFLGPRPQP